METLSLSKDEKEFLARKCNYLEPTFIDLFNENHTGAYNIKQDEFKEKLY